MRLKPDDSIPQRVQRVVGSFILYKVVQLAHAEAFIRMIGVEDAELELFMRFCIIHVLRREFHGDKVGDRGLRDEHLAPTCAGSREALSIQ